MSFGINLGVEASKTKTTTTGNRAFSNTTTPVAPPWASQLVEKGAGRIDSLFDLDPDGQVAPANALLEQAAKTAGGLSGAPGGDTSWLKPYMDADTPFASGGKAYNYVDKYLNPYLKDVVDTSAADFDAHSGQVRAQQALDLAGSGAFGGSGASLTASGTEGELARARGSLLSGLRSRGFETALGAASGDAERATQARIANGQMRLQDQAQKVGFGFRGQDDLRAQKDDLRSDASTQAALGNALRDIDQEQRAAPVTNARQIVAMLSGLPISLFTGQTEQGTSDESGTVKTKGVTVTASGSYKGGA